MSLIDIIVLSLVGIAALFGMFRGIVSQVMSLAGIAAAYLLAPMVGQAMGGWVQHQLGSSRFIAEKASIFIVGVAIYVLFRLVGISVEKLVVNRVKEFQSLNRWGGAGLGAVKAVLLIMIIFSFVTLVPPIIVKAWVPKLMESQTYRFAAKHNPMLDQTMLKRMRRLRGSFQNPKIAEKLKSSKKARELLSKYELKGAFEDKRFIESLDKGDYEVLRQNEQLEALMRDDQLEELLEQLE